MNQTIPGPANKLGLVAIGRNEGDRLRRCLTSVMGRSGPVVYVDSGSTDGSVQLAQQLGATVVELDLSIPFTAARARNSGLKALMQLAPNLEYVQFVDGDCEILPGWLETAQQFLIEHPKVAVAAGRRKERFPEHSIFNQMCDEEWNTPIGEALACGGDAMMRIVAIQQVNGYRDSLIAGEEPEMCFRLRQQGWTIMRLAQDMTLHDANIQHFGQWWRRTKRAGHAFAEGAWLHGADPERYYVRETMRALGWGLLLPVFILLAMAFVSPWSGLLTLIYPLQIMRIGMRKHCQDDRQWIRATYLVLGKFAEAKGALQYLTHRLLQRSSRLIEYK